MKTSVIMLPIIKDTANSVTVLYSCASIYLCCLRHYIIFTEPLQGHIAMSWLRYAGSLYFIGKHCRSYAGYAGALYYFAIPWRTYAGSLYFADIHCT